MRIISIVILIAFLFTNTAYSSTLRVPVGQIKPERKESVKFEVFLSLTEGRTSLSQDKAAEYFQERRLKNQKVLILNNVTMKFEEKDARDLPSGAVTPSSVLSDNFYDVYKLKLGESIDKYLQHRYVLVTTPIGIGGRSPGDIAKEKKQISAEVPTLDDIPVKIKELVEKEDMDIKDKVEKSYSIAKILAVQENISDKDVDDAFYPVMIIFLESGIEKHDENIDALIKTLLAFQFLYNSEEKKDIMDHLIEIVERAGLDRDPFKAEVFKLVGEILNAKKEAPRNAKEKLSEFLEILNESLPDLKERGKKASWSDGPTYLEDQRVRRSLKNKILTVLDLILAQAKADKILKNNTYIKEQILPVLGEDRLRFDTEIRNTAKAIRAAV